MKKNKYIMVLLLVCNHVSVKRKIGITSEDLRDNLKKFLSGTAISLSSPRLVIPATVYGLWALSQHFHNDILNFQVHLLLCCFDFCVICTSNL